LSTERSSLPVKDFLNAVLSSKPAIAVFDCDGTLWANNSGEEFFYWSMKQGLVSADVEKWARQRYEELSSGESRRRSDVRRDDNDVCGSECRANGEGSRQILAECVKPNYFEEMRRLTNALAKQRCELWAVSSTNEWVIREGIKDFGIPPHNVLAATAECTKGIVSEKLTRMPSGEGKAVAIREVMARPVDVVFGNSIHDAAMLRLAKKAYAVNPNPDLESMAKKNGWTIYWPEATRKASAK